MMIRTIVLLVLIAITPAASFADDTPSQPGFTLNFRFLPPMKVIGPVPTIFLDICTDTACNRLVQTVVLYCLAQSYNTSSPVFFNECSSVASITPRGPDGNLVLLSRPSTMRLRMNNLMSQPINFRGGVAAIPANHYLFDVGVTNTGFTVSGG